MRKAMRSSAVAASEVTHERYQRLHPGEGHGVVETRAHATDRAVPGKVDEAGSAGTGEKCLIEPCVREREGHVHPRAAAHIDRIAIEGRSHDGVIEQLSLGAIVRGHRGQPALALQPAQHQSRNVPGESRRGVEERPLLRHRVIVPYGGVPARELPTRSWRTITTTRP